jgi:hypothetical protein
MGVCFAGLRDKLRGLRHCKTPSSYTAQTELSTLCPEVPSLICAYLIPLQPGRVRLTAAAQESCASINWLGDAKFDVVSPSPTSCPIQSKHFSL